MHAVRRELRSAFSIFLQGDATMAGGVPVGDGMRCIGGYSKRSSSKNAVSGGASAPQSGDSSITMPSAALGDPIPAGATRYDQADCRDPSFASCPSPVGDAWNVSSTVAITW